VSAYKAHIFKQRNVGEREEVKLKIFGPDGEELELGGGGSESGVTYTGGAGEDPGLPNSGSIVVLDFEENAEALPDGPPGMYMGKLDVEWTTSAPTLGLASVSLIHLDEDDMQTAICTVELYADESGWGDGVLTPDGARHVKLDMGLVRNPGRFEVWVYQTTDQQPMPVWVQLSLAKF